MSGATSPLLKAARRLIAIAQNGLHYTRDPFDRERFEEIQKVAAEMLAASHDGESRDILPLLQALKGPATPRVDVRAVIVEDHNVLLVREAREQKWCLPGGWADVAISPAANAVREVAQEAGLIVDAVRLLGVHDHQLRNNPNAAIHIYKLFFQCRVKSGRFAANTETDAADFFSLDALPDLSSERSSAEQIRLFAHMCEDRGQPPAFD
jgi:ADP-ribose pyrophosphatase YjhB (NUDIX family)